jgi:hypothetical protein
MVKTHQEKSQSKYGSFTYIETIANMKQRAAEQAAANVVQKLWDEMKTAVSQKNLVDVNRLSQLLFPLISAKV